MNKDEIVKELRKYILQSIPGAVVFEPLPLDKSLLEVGILDSFGVVELVTFIENRWSIKILDSELTKEKFGGINKMADLIAEKISS